MDEDHLGVDPPWLLAARATMVSGDQGQVAAALAEGWTSARADAATLAEFGRHFLRTRRLPAAAYLFHRALASVPGDSGLLFGCGRVQFEASDFIAARRSFAAVLAQSPRNEPASRGLAWCLRQSGEPAEAAEVLREALAAQPDALPLLLDQAMASQEAGDATEARRCFDRMAQLAPDDPATWLPRAAFLREQGQPAEALSWVDRYGKRHSHDALAWLEKARCLRALGRVDQALRWLEKLEERRPGIPENSEEYGQCLASPSQAALREAHWVRAIELWTAAGNFVPAQVLATRLLAEQPASAPGWNALARLEYARQRWSEAEAAWRNALAHDPALLDAAAGLAHLYEDTNRADEAASVARAGLDQVRAGERPSGAIELQLALCKAARRSKDPETGLVHLARAAKWAATDSQREHVAFEEGRLLDMQGDAAGAFAAFARGNRLALVSWQPAHPGPNRYLAGIESMLERVRGGWLRTWQPVEAPGLAVTPALTPAFLVGFPRSGTSLLNQVLDGHSRIQALEEKPPTQKMLEAVRAMPDGYPDAIARFDAVDLGFLRDAYFRSAAEHGADDPSKLLFDKFPLHINVAALIHRVFPAARLVFSLRHPCDAVLSCFMQQFRLNHAMANFCTLEDTVALYARTMDLWEIVHTQLPIAVHTIRYEDVVADFDGQVQALCDFLQVPWEEGLRHFAARARDRGRIDTPSYAQVSRPLYRDAIHRWERYRDQLAPLLPALRPYIERFGYT